MCVGDVSNTVGSAQIHAGLSKSMWRPRGVWDHSDPADLAKSAKEGRGSLELVEIFQMSKILGRFTPVCRSRCGTRGRSAAPAPGGSYGSWDHSPCECFCLCRPIERTLPTGLWDQQRRVRSECECECECGCACYCECACECECECRALGSAAESTF